MGPRLFWCSCVLAFLKERGPAKERRSPSSRGWSTDGGIADSPRRKTPLVLPCEGRDAGAQGSPNLRKQGLSLVGGRAPNLRVQVLSLVGRDREGLLAGSRRSSSGERPRGSCEAKRGSCEAKRGSCEAREGVCEEVAVRPWFLHGSPRVPPCTVTAALCPPRLDAPVPLDAPVRPVISKKPRPQEAAPARSRARKKPHLTRTRDLPDTQREMIPPRIPPPR